MIYMPKNALIENTLGLKYDMPSPKKVKFSIGDIIVDEKNKEIGVLIEKYKLVEQEPFFGEAFADFDFWVWEVYWTGSSIDMARRLQPYTEDGLQDLILSGYLKHHKNS